MRTKKTKTRTETIRAVLKVFGDRRGRILGSDWVSNGSEFTVHGLKTADLEGLEAKGAEVARFAVADETIEHVNHKPEAEGKTLAILTADNCARLADLIPFCAEERRGAFGAMLGVNLDHRADLAVATNGAVLACMPCASAVETVTIPPQALRAGAETNGADVFRERTFGDMWEAQALDGTFPDYTRLVERFAENLAAPTAVVDVAETLKALDVLTWSDRSGKEKKALARATGFPSLDRLAYVTFSRSQNGRLRMVDGNACADVALGAEVPTVIDPQTFDEKNVRKVLNLARAVGAAEVELRFNGPTEKSAFSPLGFRIGDKAFGCVGQFVTVKRGS